MRMLLVLAAALALVGCVAEPAGAQSVKTAAYGPGPRHRLDIYRPEGAKGPAPVLVFFYGGGFMSGDRGPYGDLAEAFTRKGFVVVIPDYRLVPDVTFPGFVQDGAAAVAWVRAHIQDHGGDPGRISLAGHSAGAYIAVTLALDPSWLAKAGAPPGTVRAVLGVAGPYGNETRSYNHAVFGPNPGPGVAPITHAAATSPPAMLIAGDGDTIVRGQQGLELAKALQSKGAVAEGRIYPGFDHFSMMYTVMDGDGGAVLADMTRFLLSHSAAR